MLKNPLLAWLDSDVGHSFKSSPVAMAAAFIALVCAVSALFAPWIAPHNPLDLTTLELSDGRLPPAWQAAEVTTPGAARLYREVVGQSCRTCHAGTHLRQLNTALPDKVISQCNSCHDFHSPVVHASFSATKVRVAAPVSAASAP